jgi:hypothetical protein
MSIVDGFMHIGAFCALIVTIKWLYGDEQACTSAIVGVVAGIGTESFGAAYILAVLVIPQMFAAACVGVLLGKWIAKDSKVNIPR